MLMSSLFNKSSDSKLNSARFMDANLPMFNQFGNDIYASDVVQMCIDIIATECSKLTPKHIRIDNASGMQKNVNSSINRLFKFAPNELMTTRDFIEKVIWLLFLNNNAFIYPMYVTRKEGERLIREYKGFYPLNPVQVDFLQDPSNRLFIKFHFANGDNSTLPYSDVIHLRKKFSTNDIMGGGANGQPDNAALLKVLQINDTVLEGLGKAVKSSLQVRGIIKLNTMMEGKKQAEERKQFEKSMGSSTSGILPIDLTSDYTPIEVNPKLLDKETLSFLQSKVLNNYGVSVPILSGDFTDEQYQAFYEKTLEPLIISLSQAFSKTTFTSREIDFGNEIAFYPQKLLFTNVKNKLAVADVLGNRGAMDNNMLLELFGYMPYEGGHVRLQSLNYADVNIATQYQLNKAKAGGGKNEE